MGGAARAAVLACAVLALVASHVHALSLQVNDNVNGTLLPCETEQYSLDTSGSSAGTIQGITLEARGLELRLWADGRVYAEGECDGGACAVYVACGLVETSQWTVEVSGDNEVPVPYTLSTSKTVATVHELKSDEPLEEKEVPYDPSDPATRYRFYSISASLFANLASLNITVSPEKAAKSLYANLGAVAIEEDGVCDPFVGEHGELVVSACVLQEGTWYISVEPARDGESYTIEASIGESAVEKVPLLLNGEGGGDDTLYTLPAIGSVQFFAVKLKAPMDKSVQHTLNMTVRNVQGGEVRAELVAGEALPYSGCEQTLTSCVGSFACTNYVRPCGYEQLVAEGVDTVHVGVKVLRKDHDGGVVRFSLVVSLDGVPEAARIEPDHTYAGEVVLQNAVQYYEVLFEDDEDDEVYANIYLYGDSLSLAGVQMYVGTDRFDDESCFTFDRSCEVVGEDEVGSCGIQLSPCEIHANSLYFVTVEGGPLVDAVTGFPYTLSVERETPHSIDAKEDVLEERALLDGAYEHFELRIDDEDAVRVTVGNVLYGEVDVFLYSGDDALAGDPCASGQCYQADSDEPAYTFGGDGGSFVVQHCECGGPEFLSLRGRTDEEHHDRPVAYTVSWTRARDGDFDVEELEEDDRVIGTIGGTWRGGVDAAYFQFDASLDDNDEVELTLAVNDLPPGDGDGDAEFVEMSLFIGSGKNVFCEECSARLHCAVKYPDNFCTVVLQPCEFDAHDLERSHVRVLANTRKEHQFQLSLESRSLDPETVRAGVAETGVVGVGQYRHFRVPYPEFDDDDAHDYTATYALLVELYLDQGADTTASLFINADKPAGEVGECYHHVASSHGKEAIDLTLDACRIIPDETYYFSVRGDSAVARNAIPFTVVASWVREQVPLEANVPRAMALYPSQRIVHTFNLTWGGAGDAVYAALTLSSVEDVNVYASLGTPDSADVSSCCFDVLDRVLVPGDSEVTIPVPECYGDTFLLLVQPMTMQPVRYVAMLSVSDAVAADPLQLGTPAQDSVPSGAYHFYHVEVEDGNDDDRFSVSFTNVRGGTVRAYVSNEGPASASSCSGRVEPCVGVHGDESACVVHLSGCGAGYAEYLSVYGESEDGGDVFYTLEASEHRVREMRDGERTDRLTVHSAQPESFVLAVPDASAYSSYAQPTVKVILSDITDASSRALSVRLGHDLCVQPHELVCTASSACVLYLPACDFEAGDYYATITAEQDDVEFDLEMTVVDVEQAGVQTVGDEPVTLEIQAHNYQVFKVPAGKDGAGAAALQELTVTVTATDPRDEITGTLDASATVAECGPAEQCDEGNSCTLVVEPCCLEDRDSFYVTVYNPSSTQFEIETSVTRRTTASVDDVELPFASEVELEPLQTAHFVFTVDEAVAAAASLTVAVREVVSANETASTPVGVYLQENALASAGNGSVNPCEGGAMASDEGEGAAGLQLFPCHGLRESRYGVAVMNRGTAARSFAVTMEVAEAGALELDDAQTLKLAADATSFVQYELDASAVASPFTDLQVVLSGLEGGDTAAGISAALNYNYPASTANGLCPGHVLGEGGTTCTVRGDGSCTLRVSVCDYAGTYYLGIRNDGGVTSVKVSPGVAGTVVPVDVISGAPRNVTADEEDLQLFRTDRELTLDGGNYFELELRSMAMEEISVFAAWGGACPTPIEMECDTDRPASCYFRLYSCELPPQSTVYVSVHTRVQYSISYAIRRPDPTELEVGDSVSGTFVGLAVPQFFEVKLSSGSVPSGGSLVVEVEAGCGDVLMDVNVGALAGGTCVVGSGTSVELSACELLSVGDGSIVSIQLEATDDFFKVYAVPVKYTLRVRGSVAHASTQVLPLLPNAPAAYEELHSSFSFAVDSLGLFAGDIEVDFVLPMPAREPALPSLSVSFSGATGCGGDVDPGCTVKDDLLGCTFTVSPCELRRHSTLFLVPSASTPLHSTVEVRRAAQAVTLVDASYIDFESLADDDDDNDGDHPHSFLFRGAVSAGHAEYYRVLQNPVHPTHLLNVTLTVDARDGAEAALLMTHDAPAELACAEALCSTAVNALDNSRDAVGRCSLFLGQNADEVFVTVMYEPSVAALVEYELRMHFMVPAQRTTLLDLDERVCADVEPGAAAYFVADFVEAEERIPRTAITTIEVSTVVEGVELDVLLNSDGAWATPESATTRTKCTAQQVCVIEFACPVLDNVTVSVTAHGALHSVPITVLWSEPQQEVTSVFEGVTYSRGQYFMLTYPDVEKDEVVLLEFQQGDPSQRLLSHDDRLPGAGSSCYQQDCTFDCMFLCQDYLLLQKVYLVVENAHAAPFRLSWRVVPAPAANALALGRASAVQLPENEVRVFRVDVSDVDSYAQLNVLVYGVPRTGGELSGKISLWAGIDEQVDRDCAAAAALVDDGNGKLVLPHCALDGAESVYVSVVVYEQRSPCADVAFTVKPVLIEAAGVHKVPLGEASTVSVVSNAEQWFAIEVPADKVTGDALLDVTLEGVTSFDLAATLHSPGGDECACARPLTSQSLYVPPCCLAAGTYYLSVFPLRVDGGAGSSYLLSASVVTPETLRHAEPVDTQARSSGRALYYAVSGYDDEDSISVTYTPRADAAVLSLWENSGHSCARIGAPTTCASGPCSFDFSEESVRPEPIPLVMQVELRGAAAAGEVEWRSGADENCAPMGAKAACAGFDVWIGGRDDQRAALDAGASRLFEEMYEQLFCADSCNCQFVSASCRTVLREYACELSLPVCSGDGYRTAACHKTCRDVEHRCDVSLAHALPQYACEHQWLDRTCGDTTPPSPPPPSSPSFDVSIPGTTPATPTTPATSDDSSSHSGFGTSLSGTPNTLEWVIFGVFTFFFFLILLLAVAAGTAVFIRKRRAPPAQAYAPLEVNYE